MKEYRIYILQSLKDKKHYTGYTSDINLRVLQHEQGRVKSTKSRRPLKLIYTEKFSTSKEARAREKFLKSHPGRTELKQILK